MIGTRKFAIWVALGIGLLFGILPWQKSVAGSVAEDGYCGARSVHFMLQFYGVDRSLHDVARDMREPGEPGVSVGNVITALSKGGLKFIAVPIHSLDELRPHLPCIILRAVDESPDGLGHFQLLLEVTDDHLRLWDGLKGPVVAPVDEVPVGSVQAGVICAMDVHQNVLKMDVFAIVVIAISLVVGWKCMSQLRINSQSGFVPPFPREVV